MKSHAFIGFVFYAALIGNRYSIVRFGKEDRIPPPISSFSLPFSIKSTAAQTTQGMHFVLGGGDGGLRSIVVGNRSDVFWHGALHRLRALFPVSRAFPLFVHAGAWTAARRSLTAAAAAFLEIRARAAVTSYCRDSPTWWNNNMRAWSINS